MTSIYEWRDTVVRIRRGGLKGSTYEENSDAKVESFRGVPQRPVRELESPSLLTGIAADRDGGDLQL